MPEYFLNTYLIFFFNILMLHISFKSWMLIFIRRILCFHVCVCVCVGCVYHQWRGAEIPHPLAAESLLLQHLQGELKATFWLLFNSKCIFSILNWHLASCPMFVQTRLRTENKLRGKSDWRDYYNIFDFMWCLFYVYAFSKSLNTSLWLFDTSDQATWILKG